MTININDIKTVKNSVGFQDIDLHFAGFVSELSKTSCPELFLAAALASYSVRNSHVCTPLEQFAGQNFPEYPAENCDIPDYEQFTVAIPEIIDLTRILRDPQYASVISAPEDQRRTPLILDRANRLYLYRYWEYEQELAELIYKRCCSSEFLPTQLEPGEITSCSKLFSTFSANSSGAVDWQQVAVYTALTNPFSVITGGPGTGKTTVVAAIIALLLEHNPDCRIKLCAPTGKAQARLREAVMSELDNLNCSEPVRQRITGLEAFTLHAMLGTIHNSPDFRHGPDNPLDAQLVIVDEASMVSLPIMTKLFLALAPETRIILLGDKDQLASVESGAVLADICEASELNRFSPVFTEGFARISGSTMPQLPSTTNPSWLTDCAVELKVSHRFDDNAGIGLVRNAVNKVNSEPAAQNALNITANENSGQFKLLPLPEYATLESRLDEILSRQDIVLKDGQPVPFRAYPDILNSNVPDALDRTFEILNNFKILCAARHGFFGVLNLNAIVRRLLKLENDYASGLPLLITENDYSLNLFNGDIGICRGTINSKGLQETRVFFPNSRYDGTNPDIPRYVSFAPTQLPAHESVFAMTIHKSQGSGFRNVLMILPSRDSSLLTRELIYTGITRAGKYAELWANNDIFIKAITRKTLRDTGLSESLARFQS